MTTPRDTSSAEAKPLPTRRDVLNLAWPLGLKAMMLHGMLVIDAYLVSALGEIALAAMGVAMALGGLMLGFLFAFSNATQIRIAQAYGGGDPVALKSGLYIGIGLNLAVAVAGMVLVLVFGPLIIGAIAKTQWIAEQAQRYLNVFLLLVVVEAIGQCLGSYFNGCGRTKLPFYSHLISIPVNVSVSYVLIHGHLGMPELGVVGAAVGSVLGSLSRTIFLTQALFRLNRAYLDVKGWHRGSFGLALRRHMVFALPIAGTFVSMVIANNVCTMIYSQMSVNDFAAMTLIIPWVQVAGVFGICLAQSIGIIIAQMLGQNRTGPELDAFLSRAWRLAFSAAAIVAFCYLVICLSSAFIYADLQDQTKAALLGFLPILLLLPFPKGSNAVCGHTLRAGGDTVYVMNIFVAGQWAFKVPMTLLFVLVLNLPVFWVFALSLGEELVKFPLFHRRLFKGKWKEGLKD